jgi:hypothetical protein
VLWWTLKALATDRALSPRQEPFADLDRQIAALRSEACDRIFREKASGKAVHGRPAWRRVCPAYRKMRQAGRSDQEAHEAAVMAVLEALPTLPWKEASAEAVNAVAYATRYGPTKDRCVDRCQP